MMVGTVNYMSPEQLRGEKSDHRADIFSFGVVIYELLSGKKPFQADSFASTMYKILNETPEALDRIDPSLPPHLTAIVDRAIAKSRDDRYQHMTELARDLATAYEGLRGSDMRVLSHITSRTPPPSNVLSRPLDHLTSPDAVTIATPVPSLVQTAAAVGTPPPTPFPATPLPQPGPAPSTTGASSPDVRPAPGSWRWVYVTAFGIALAGLSIFVLRDRTPQPASTAPAAQATPSAPAPPSGPPLPAPPVSGPQPAERPEIPERREPEEPQEVAERPEPPEARPPEPSSRAADRHRSASRASEPARESRVRSGPPRGGGAAGARSACPRPAQSHRLRAARAGCRRRTPARRDRARGDGLGQSRGGGRRCPQPRAVALFGRRTTGKSRPKGEQQQDFATAAARMEAATTLFKTAETGARTELEARAARAQAAENPPPRRSDAARAAPAPAPAPARPRPKPESVPVPPASPVKAQAAVAASSIDTPARSSSAICGAESGLADPQRGAADGDRVRVQQRAIDQRAVRQPEDRRVRIDGNGHRRPPLRHADARRPAAAHGDHHHAGPAPGGQRLAHRVGTPSGAVRISRSSGGAMRRTLLSGAAGRLSRRCPPRPRIRSRRRRCRWSFKTSSVRTGWS